mgnify:CR=1 FL=1
MSNINDKNNRSESVDPKDFPDVDFDSNFTSSSDNQEDISHINNTTPPSPFDSNRKEEEIISRPLDELNVKNNRKKRDNNKIAVVQIAMYKIQEEHKNDSYQHPSVGDKQYLNDSIEDNFNEQQQELLKNALDNNYDDFTNNIEENIYDLLKDQSGSSEDIDNQNENNIQEESEQYYELLSNMSQNDYQELLNKATLSAMDEFVNEYDEDGNIIHPESNEQNHNDNDIDDEKTDVENQNYTEGVSNKEENDNIPKVNFGITRKDESISDGYVGSPDYTDQIDWVDQNTKNTLSDALKYSDEINEDQFENALEFARDKRDEEDERRRRSKKLPPIPFAGKNETDDEDNIEDNTPVGDKKEDTDATEISSKDSADLDDEENSDDEENINENEDKSEGDTSSNKQKDNDQGEEGEEGQERGEEFEAACIRCRRQHRSQEEKEKVE